MPRRTLSDKVPTQASWSVEEVVELAARYNLAELEVESGGIRIRVVREHAPAGAVPHAEPARAEHAQSQLAPAEDIAATNLITIEAPMVGTFYRATAPGAAPYVNEGDVVKQDQVLCVIEAMKLMNEIEAKVAGRIAKVLVENGQPVEYGQPLFSVEPHG
jgi:acetyl-CoA carboxylase biotin carboxyl carrier protein